jgi:hypothetical protein
MNEEAILVAYEDDVSLLDVLCAAMPDQQGVAGFERRKHAAAAHAKPHLAVLSQDVRDQLRRGGQEFFLTNLHAPIVGFVLPHASAIVSNNCSRAKRGFSYGLRARVFGSEVA